MTRLQKKCLIFSLGLHGLLLVVLFASAGFRTIPPTSDLQIISMIPAKIVDGASTGGGMRMVSPTPSPSAASRPQPQPTRATAHTEPVERAVLPTHHQSKETPRPQELSDKSDKSDKSEVLNLESKSTKKRSTHEVQVSYTPANPSAKGKKPGKTPSTVSSSQSEARRLKAIADSLSELANGVKTGGSPNEIVDVEGIGGGEAFAGYRDVVFSAYYHAWITPDSVASRAALVEAKVVIARDGSVISAELARPSNDRGLDQSVEQALRRVTKLPPFPESAHDAQRTFILHFSPEAKEMSG